VPDDKGGYMFTPIGLDLSLTSTGWSCQNEQGVISVKQRGVERLISVTDRIMDIVQEVDNPAVFIEGYSFASIHSHAHSLGELGGVTRYRLRVAGVPFVEVPPTCRAKLATGKGNSAKSAVVSAVSVRTGIVWSGAGVDDMCDAWLLEEVGWIYQQQPRSDWPKEHLKALDKVDFAALRSGKAE
jgi:crossover junction endodeoxyribonuclease RuvC